MAKNKGIILRSIDFKETSKIIYLITESGIRSVIVRGAKKLTGRTLFLTNSFTEIEYQAKEADLPVLTDGDLLFDFSGIRNDYLKYFFAENISAYLYLASPEVDFPLLYRLFQASLKLIDNYQDAEIISFAFEIKFLFFLGLKPELTNCVCCGNLEIAAIDVDKGGFICHLHKGSQTFDSEVALAIKELYYSKLELLKDLSLSSNVRQEIRQFISSYYQRHANFINKVTTNIRKD
ncbi:MAG: DNA repair protein RecO [Erysipelotrichales bacterium]|nr:DNA repair protein RecO [Erysipelotrichales bacterium]